MSVYQLIGLILVLIYPIVALTVHYAGDGLFAILFILSLVFFYLERRNLKRIFQILPWWFYALFFIHPIIILTQSLLNHHWYGAGLDASFRLIFIPFILLFLAKIESKYLKYFYMASALGCLITLGFTLMQFDGERAQVVLMGGSYSLLSPTRLGYYVVNFGIFSMGLLWQSNRLEKFLGVAGIVAAMFISYLTETRGAWLSIFGIILFLIVYFNKQSPMKLLIQLNLALLIGIIVFSVNPKINDRMKLAYQEFRTPTNLSTQDASSVGHRKQLYTITALMIMKHPLFGVGRDNFQSAYNETVKNNNHFDYEKMGPEPHTHPHNELLYAWAELGIFGFIGLLLLYLGPGWFFWKHRLSQNPDIRIASLVGMVMVVHYVISGLPDIVLIFNVLKSSLYGISMIILMAIILNLQNNQSRFKKK